eukprot:augustus_masked-scaffold_2-processed-gene-5.59-mRNA-1 protein AED:0.79 eAED:0.79 QI:0/-1/0/1/-1/1/1/0/937
MNPPSEDPSRSKPPPKPKKKKKQKSTFKVKGKEEEKSKPKAKGQDKKDNKQKSKFKIQGKKEAKPSATSENSKKMGKKKSWMKSKGNKNTPKEKRAPASEVVTPEPKMATPPTAPEPPVTISDPFQVSAQETETPPLAMNEWNRIRSEKNIKPLHGKNGQRVQILTNRVQVMDIPKKVSIFHFKFFDAEGKESKQKVDLAKYLDLEKQPIAYDGSKIFIQYGICSGAPPTVKSVHQDSFVLDRLRKPLTDFKDRVKLDGGVIYKDLSTDGSRLDGDDFQYLDIIFQKYLPKSSVKELGDDGGSRGRGRGRVGRGDRGGRSGRGTGRGGGRGGYSAGGPSPESQTLRIEYKYKTSIVQAEGSSQLSIDVSGNLVYKEMSFLDFLQKSNLWSNGRFNKDPKYVAKDVDGIKLRPNFRTASNTLKCKGFTQKTTAQQKFELDGKQVSVRDYFKTRYKLDVNPNFPCVITSTRKGNYYPLEALQIVKEQKFTRELPRSALKDVHLKPNVRHSKIEKGVQDFDKILKKQKQAGLALNPNLIKTEGREIGSFSVRKGSKFVNPKTLSNWIVVNGDERSVSPQDLQTVVTSFTEMGQRYGMRIANCRRPITIRGSRDYGPAIKPYIQKGVELILLIKNERDKDLYNEAKRISYLETGVPVQVTLSKHFRRADPRRLRSYMENLLLKVNMKLGGVNFLPRFQGLDSNTLVLGMDVSHGMLNNVDAEVASNSTVALVSSSHFLAAFASQKARTELVKKEVMLKLLDDVVGVQNKSRFSRVLFYRDGVSESMFNQVNDVEIETIRSYFSPQTKLTFLVLQKRHRTKFFKLQGNRIDNPEAGTVIDRTVTNLQDYDFYLQAHRCGIGTARIPHYVVLHNENNFDADSLQMLTNQLSSYYQRSFGAVSQTTASYYAHLLADKCRFLMNTRGEMPKLHARLRQISQMYFL